MKCTHVEKNSVCDNCCGPFKFRAGDIVKMGELEGKLTHVPNKDYPLIFTVGEDLTEYSFCLTAEGKIFDTHKAPVITLVRRPKKVTKTIERWVRVDPDGRKRGIYRTELDAMADSVLAGTRVVKLTGTYEVEE